MVGWAHISPGHSRIGIYVDYTIIRRDRHGNEGSGLFEEKSITAQTKAEFYDILKGQLHHLLEGEANSIANLSNTAALLNLHVQDINWVGFYLWQPADEQLVLGPFQGKPACIRIALGKGVCGTAAKERESVVVADVLTFNGHIACDPVSRSEVVIPLVVGDELIGVLDIDSPLPGRFDEADKAGLEQVVQVILQHTKF